MFEKTIEKNREFVVSRISFALHFKDRSVKPALCLRFSLSSVYESLISGRYSRSMQEVHLDKHVKLLDSPGIVMDSGYSDAAVILRNCVKVKCVYIKD